MNVSEVAMIGVRMGWEGLGRGFGGLGSGDSRTAGAAGDRTNSKRAREHTCGRGDVVRRILGARQAHESAAVPGMKASTS
jgi:hypothetical protein